MADDPNVSNQEQSDDHLISRSAKHPTASNVPTDDRSPRTAAQPKQCTHGTNGRNLIVCIDGTSNQFGRENTNVIELYKLILKEVEHNQRTWYNSGIGTYARPSFRSFKFYRQVLAHKIDLMVALTFERTILAAYQWLSDNYEPGDCIFLFGFSRGAYQVRVLSAMIDTVGLIYKGNEMQIPFAFELYSDSDSNSPRNRVPRAASSQLEEDSETMAQRFKDTFSYKDVRVHFVGAWDTVSSIGIARSNNMLPRTIDGMGHVCYFRHALALDERRVKFLPEYARGGTSNDDASTGNVDGPSPNDEPSDDLPRIEDEAVDNRLPDKMKPAGKRPHTKEVWFAGTHSDIGGGNVDNPKMDRGRPPLRWMVFEAGALGLRTAPFERDLSPNEQIEIKESLTWYYWILEILPFGRLTYTRRAEGKKNTHKPHLGSSRKIHPGQKIHSSLTLSNNTNYTPKARPLNNDPHFWENARKNGLGDWLELDLYDYTQTLVERLISERPGTALQTLRETVKSADGLQAVYDAIIGALSKLDPEAKLQLLKSAVDVVGMRARNSTTLQLGAFIEIHALMSDIWETDKKLVQRFLGHFTDCCRLVVDGHTENVRSVAFSPLGDRIVSGSGDGTIRIWDAEMGKPVGEPFRGHADWVLSVAFSPDGRRAVSGSCDETIRIWNAETGKQVGEPFRGHTDWVRSVAFSPNGSCVVSGSDDRTVRIWDAETGRPVGEPFQGHKNSVCSVAFSPDGKRILSGSDDSTVRLWDAETGKPVGEPFRGHTRLVMSFAFSPDGKRVASGSSDDTIQICDVVTGKAVGEPFQGHKKSVWSVAFSPDGKRIVSGSSDITVRIWDVETGKQLGEPFRGHTNHVGSVAFSPDGKRIVSGSSDTTIRIWDVEAAEAAEAAAML